jgi:hypothetical protein
MTTACLKPALAALMLVVMLWPPPSHAKEPGYSDADSHPLKVVYYLLQPVGKLLELAVFRPVHWVGSRLSPEPGTAMTRPRGCREAGRRPHRYCSSTVP